MTEEVFDAQAAHRQFSIVCFNAAWKYLEKEPLELSEMDELLSLAHASLWHWKQRDDCKPENISVGCWQISRAWAKVGSVRAGRLWARRCLEVSDGLAPFYLGYAYEALARAEALGGHETKARQCLNQARALADEVTDEDSRNLLLQDLDSIS